MGSDKRERQKAGRQARLEQARAEEARRKRRRTIRNASIFGVLVIVLALVLARPWQSDDDGDDEVATDGSTTTTVSSEVPEFAYGTGPCPSVDGSSPRTIEFTDAPQLCIDPSGSYTAVFETNLGTVEVALDAAEVPGTVNNFVTLARYGFYDDTDLFRTNTGLGIVQGGSPSTNSPSDPGPGYDLADEGFVFEALPGADVGQPTGGPYRYEAGDLVMARAAVPDGAGAQYFFCATDDCAALDSQGVYVTFGEVTSGQDVVEQIIASHVDGGQSPGEGAPAEPVTVLSVTIREDAGAPADDATSTTAVDGDDSGSSTTAGDDGSSTTTAPTEGDEPVQTTTPETSGQ